MSDRNLEQWAGAVGIAVCLLIGLPVLIDQVFDDGGVVTGPWWIWWICYFGFITAYVSIWFVPEQVRWLTSHRLLAAQSLLASAAVLLSSSAGWTAILLVFTAASAAYFISARTLGLLIAAHSSVVALAAWINGSTLTGIALAALIYAMLQVCSVLSVSSQIRETAARTELAATNVQLRTATALLAESSRAEERLRIARELHDLVGHQLTALVLELEVAIHRDGPQAREHVTRSRGLAKDLLSDVRIAVGELRTRSPQLRAAIDSIVADLPRPRVHLQVDETVEVDEERTRTLIRCVQEIVTNTIRHAGADNLWIDIVRTDEGQVVLRTRDDGRGAPVLRLGHGLTGLRERVQQLGGSVSFASQRGFRVVAEMPAT